MFEQMSLEDARQWGALLTAYGEGKQLQRLLLMKERWKWVDSLSPPEDLQDEQPNLWRVKPEE